jgi:hypothetical protein
VPHRGPRAINRFGDLRARQARLDEHRKLLPSKGALCGVALVSHGLQSIFRKPVRNRRFVAPKTPSDLGQRQALAQ